MKSAAESGPFGKATYRNVWTGATFTVIGKDAVARMDALASWVRP